MKGLKNLWQALTHKMMFKQDTIMDEKSVEEVFNELESVVTKKQRVTEYLATLAVKEEETKRFEALDKKTINALNVLAGRAKAIEEKKQNLKGRLINQNAALMRLVPYEDEIPDIIKEMQEAEKRKRETENNMYYLREEREELLEERESLLSGYSFLKGFSIVFIGLIGIGILVIFALMQVLREAVWFYLTFATILLVLFLAGLLYAKERIEKALERNTILQQKAVRYLNKSKIRYFHQMRYLDFQYHKLGVDSAAKLEMYYTRYVKNKNNEKVYLQMNETLSQIEDKMLAILKEHHINIDYIDNLTEWALNPKKVNALKNVKVEYQKTEEQLQGLNTYEQELWKEILVMQEDSNLKAVVTQKIKKHQENHMLDKAQKGA
ncbi:hypothetical protein [Cellulosilyticum ruminicola]|uniref:hypothetical protein n=1 Tax=Cellulosilyticum ruminicola TaxID=425254 RepID=UPI0006CF464D|nr:hypothetical protein [Cellulosilyticum ruminicola]